jgi:cysteine desulfurase/selenocysteine lyase
MPLHQKLDLLASTRASFYIYNTKEEVDFLVKGIQKVIDYFK